MSKVNQADVNVLPDHPEKATLAAKNKFLGFWFFLGGETVLFGTLFATFIALRNQTNGGPAAHDLFSMPLVFLSTMILLTSSLTSAFAIIAMRDNNIRQMRLWFLITVLFGIAFLVLEITEFKDYIHEDMGYTTSAFSSSFYTLVGFHGAHVFFGVSWISALMIQSFKKGITTVTAPKYYVASLYWHFIDVVWVFIFTVVYLLGILGG